MLGVIPAALVQNDKAILNAFSPVGLVYALGNNKFLHWVQSVVKYYDTGELDAPKVASRLLKVNIKILNNFSNVRKRSEKLTIITEL